MLGIPGVSLQLLVTYTKELGPGTTLLQAALELPLASKIPDYRLNLSGLWEIRRMYSSRRGSRVSRLKGINEFLSYEGEAEEGAGDLEPESAPVASPKAAETPRTKAAGKRALTEEEAVQYEKRTRRKLLVDPPSQKLMADAFKSAGREGEQESADANQPLHTRLHSKGPAFSSDFSSYHPLEEEGGNESLIVDVESSPATEPIISPFPDQASDATLETSLAVSPVRETRPPADEIQSPAASVLLPWMEAAIPSPTTGIMTKEDATTSSPGLSTANDEEPLDYGTSSPNDGAGEEGGDGNEEEDESDEDSTGWADPPPPSSDKASAYVPSSPLGSPTHETVDKTLSPEQQAAAASLSEPTPVTTASLQEESPTLMIPLKSTGTESALSSAQAGTLMVLPSSPSQLDISKASPASSRSSLTVFAPGSMILSSSTTSPMKSLSPVVIPSVLKILV
ncbi:fibrous sheath CABYR-binding protein-like [Asparagus officinalis]|uniref:fibrous sheath CABYR-binding protein-like n=1 Tax=Asparagus officinalis TaxID=4686 RepID=UPI00098E26A5|nr:fibrous sheath CABYR-binding protein-like [Asparagus officinalis]